MILTLRVPFGQVRKRLPEAKPGSDDPDQIEAPCPICGGVLLAGEDAGGLTVLRCRKCGLRQPAKLLSAIGLNETDVVSDQEPPQKETRSLKARPAQKEGKRQKRRRSSDDEGPGIVKQLADAIQADLHFARTGSLLFVYQNGVYVPKGEEAVRAAVKRILEETEQTAEWSSHKANEVAEYIRIDAPELWGRPPDDVVNLDNGLLDVSTGELMPHTPDFLSPVRIPVTYDPSADCPHWRQFIATSFPDDTQELAFELVAWLMLPDTSIQKAVLLLGEGSNGKSTFLTALIAFLGKQNVTSKSLQKLEKDKFAVSSLVGKLANICPDLPSAHLSDTGIFKALTGTEAQLDAEIKYKEAFEFEPIARLVFSANSPPCSNDATHAFFRRWLVVPFGRTFEEGTEFVPIPRKVLDARLADPKELSGVLNMALAVLPRVRESGITETVSMRAAWNEFRQETDPLAVWLDQATVEMSDGVVSKKALHAAFARHCASLSVPDPGSNSFGRSLKRLRPNLTEKQRTVDGKVDWCWLGIALKDGQDNAAPTSQNSRDSRDFTYSTPSSARAQDGKQGEDKEYSGENPVNRVNGVKPVYSADLCGENQPSTNGAKNGHSPHRADAADDDALYEEVF